MLRRNLNSVARYYRCNVTKSCRFFSSETSAEHRDPAPFFFHDDVQHLLKTLTRENLKKVFRPRKDGTKIQPAEYKFMTDEELEEAMQEAKRKAEMFLQMPPVVKERTEINVVLSKDPALQGHSYSNFVFTDITFGVSDHKRMIVVREPNGLLRRAKWNERFRMNQIYFPMVGREMTMPKMFEGEHLKDLLRRQEYEFVLDRACVQFEPDDPEYHRVVKKTYETVNATRQFDHLRSTRHFGPLVFHLVWNRNIEDLLSDILQSEKIDEAVSLIKLYHKIHPDSKSADKGHDGDDIKFIQDFAKMDSVNEGKVMVALNLYKEMQSVKQQVEDGIKKAHGFED